MTQKMINGKTAYDTVYYLQLAADSNGKDHPLGTDAVKSLDILDRYPNVTSDELKFVYRYIICSDHTGKMKSLHSLSSCCCINSNCLANMSDPTKICSHCFANDQLHTYFSQYVKQVIATYFLVMDVWDEHIIPTDKVRSGLFRFESFGDILPVKDGGYIQAANYLNFAHHNSHLRCAVWTKSPAVYAGPIAEFGKPENLQFVYSDPFMNGSRDKAKFDAYILDTYKFVDKIFTVYENEKAAEAAGIVINCGARDCSTCQRCYTAGLGVNVNELKK